MKRTFVFEDLYFDLEAIKAILGKIPEIHFVGSGSPIDTVGEALEVCAKYKPDLIIADADIHSDKNAGPKFVRMVKEILPEVRILGMTRYEECFNALKQAGCNFVVNKNLIENEKAAVKYIRETFLPSAIFGTEPIPPKLSPDEDTVLRYIRDGLIEDQIKVKMGFNTRRPVRSLKDSLFRKFGAENIANLIDLAYKSGYLRPDK